MNVPYVQTFVNQLDSSNGTLGRKVLCRNQRGEVVTGVMIITMAVMMIFGGMHMVQGGTGPKEITDSWNRSTITMRTARNTMHDHAEEHDSVPSRDEAK
jgi:hypothetical protein